MKQILNNLSTMQKGCPNLLNSTCNCGLMGTTGQGIKKLDVPFSTSNCSFYSFPTEGNNG